MLRIEQARVLARLDRQDEAASLAREAAAALRNAQPADAAHGFAPRPRCSRCSEITLAPPSCDQLASEAQARSNRAARAEP